MPHVIKTKKDFDNHRSNFKFGALPTAKTILMVTPTYFDVVYAINPFMKNQDGSLKRVDQKLAFLQWADLKSVYSSLKLEVETIEGVPGLPDMVFAANQSFVYWNAGENCKAVVMAKMASSERQPEVQHFEEFFKQQNYLVQTIPSSVGFFEGHGDALTVPGANVMFGGVGPRTHVEAYYELSKLTGMHTIILKPVLDSFYHLDTCFSILNHNTVAYVPDAFEPEQNEIIESFFAHKIRIQKNEALEFMGGNCHSPNGKDVILQKGSHRLISDLKNHNFNVHEVDVSEYIKSGGAVFCMKTQIF
jgi:N-dimethylarginine dimethylaminohydrolase